MDEREDQPIRDLDRSSTTNWPRLAYPLKDRPGGAAVKVVCKQSVLNEIHRHGQSRTDVEICGVLVGNGYQDDSGPFVYVEASIRGEFAGSQLAQVTFTHETWNHIQGELDQRHPGKRIVGWYHTHPGFGIFLSPMDLFIHENFFNSPEQLALVYDPLSGEQGIFVWRSGKPSCEPVQVEEDTAVEPNVVVIKRLPGGRLTAAADTESDDVPSRLSRLERRQRWLLAGLGLITVVAIGWPMILPAIKNGLGSLRQHGERPPINDHSSKPATDPRSAESVDQPARTAGPQQGTQVSVPAPVPTRVQPPAVATPPSSTAPPNSPNKK